MSYRILIWIPFHILFESLEILGVLHKFECGSTNESRNINTLFGCTLLYRSELRIGKIDSNFHKITILKPE